MLNTSTEFCRILARIRPDSALQGTIVHMHNVIAPKQRLPDLIYNPTKDISSIHFYSFHFIFRSCHVFELPRKCHHVP